MQKKIDAKKQHIFAETCLYESVGTLPVMPSLLPMFFEKEVKFSKKISSVVSPDPNVRSYNNDKGLNVVMVITTLQCDILTKMLLNCDKRWNLYLLEN